MGKVIAIANQKGGVGKTTTAINLAAALAMADTRVLIVDLDAQANCTSGLGFAKDSERRSVYHVLVQGEPVDGVILDTELENLKLIPSDRDLAGAAVELMGEPDREFVLRQILGRLGSRFDFVIIDTPPSLNILTVNALVASDSVLVPIQCEYFALEGISDLLDTLSRVRRSFNPGLLVQGIIVTMFDERVNLSAQVMEDLRSYFTEKVLETVIPRNVRLAEAPSFGKPIFLYDIRSKGAQSYIRLAKEILTHEKESIGERIRSANT